jgi:hypothetical protein
VTIGELLRDSGNGITDAKIDVLCQIPAQLGELCLRGSVGLEEVAVHEAELPLPRRATHVP